MTSNEVLLDVIHELTCESVYLLELSYADNTHEENEVIYDKIGDNLQKIEVLSRRCL